MISIPKGSFSSTGQWRPPFARLSRFAAFLAIFIFACTAAMAQLSTADIVGTVTDPTGALVPNAKVTLQNLDTHQERSATTNSTGDYLFTLLPVGRYSITVKASGFKTANVTNLSVEAGDRARSDVHLATGTESDTITVDASTPLLQADNATVSSTVTAKAVQDLPLNGRNFVQLVQIVPGANEGPGNGLTSGGRPDDRRVSASFSVNGQDDTLNNYIIDGADDNERIIGTIGVRPNVEGIQEITVQTNSYSVEAGRTAGGVVNITTKSGTNHFHGSAYEFFRNDIFDARNALQTTGNKPELRQNQFGGSLGGPIIKDRTFFFADYEGFRQVSGVTYSNTVPTLNLYDDINSLNGGSPQAILNASTDGVATYCASNPNCIDPIALNYLKLYPAPTNSNITNNEVISPNKTQFSNTVDARVDHRFTANNLFFGRFTYNKVDTFTPPGLGTVGGFQISGGEYNFSGPATDKAYQYGLGFTHIFNQNILLDLRATYTRINNLSLPLNYGLDADTKVGFGTNMNFDALSNFLTPIGFGSFPDIGDGAYVPLQDVDNTYQYSGTLSWTLGNHSVKIGAQLIRRQARNIQSAFAAGQYGFGLTNDNVSGNTPQTYINQLASSLVGAFTSENRNYDLNPPDYRSWEPSGFVLDSWKVSPRLTVLYGVRYDVFTPFTEAHDHISDFDFNKALNSTASTVNSALLVAGQNGVSSTAGIETNYSDAAPRIGFSYSATPTTVIRGGYGLSFFPGNYTSNADLKNAPFVSVYSPVCGQSDLALTLQTGAAYGNLPQSNYPSTCFTAANDSTHTFDAGLPLPSAPSITNLSAINALSFEAEDTKFRPALIQQFNLQVEQQFGANVFTIGYVGNIGQHLPETINNINQPAPFDPFSPTFTTAQGEYKLYNQLPNLGGVSWLQSEGISNYNALQTSFQRRFVHGLAFDANYTWAKALSDITGFSEEGDQGWSNADPTRIRQIDYGVAENDIQNRFALTLNYTLPFGANFTGIKRQVLHGWEINTLSVWQSGKPITIFNGGQNDVTTTGDGAGNVYGNRAVPYNNGGNDRPNKVGNGGNPHKLSEWFNTANYAPQPLGTVGDAQRNSEFGPHFRHIDLSLFKDFPVTERVNAQFRVETFDITNTPDYYIPNNGNSAAQLGSSTFGQAGDNLDPNYVPRELQFALKLQF